MRMSSPPLPTRRSAPRPADQDVAPAAAVASCRSRAADQDAAGVASVQVVVAVAAVEHRGQGHVPGDLAGRRRPAGRPG